MARFGIASVYSYSLGWWTCLQDEGHEVKVWNKERLNKRVGEGITQLAGTFDELCGWLREGAVRGIPSVLIVDGSGMGDDADAARKAGLLVLGGCKFADKLEKDRAFGFEIAESVGCKLPPHEQYASLSESESAMPDDIGDVYFKSDRFLSSDATKGLKDKEHLHEYFEGLKAQHGDNIKHIIQQKIEGVPLSTARWWNGHDWTGPYQATYEHKAFMDGDIGSSTGCSFNAMFFHEDDPPIAESLGWEGLTSAFRNGKAAPGLYDINAVVDERGDVYFLEWTPRLGYDSEMTSFKLFPELGRHLYNIASGGEMPTPKGEIAYSIRLSVPPYPWEFSELDDKKAAVGRRVRAIDGLWRGQFVGYQLRLDKEAGLVVASPEGIVGLSMGIGPKLEGIHDKALEYAKELGKRGVDALQFRTDGAKCIKEDAEKVEAAGHTINKGLVQ